MLLNSLRKGILSIPRITLKRVVENRLIHLPVPESSNAILLDMRKCEQIWKRSKNSSMFQQHLYDCFTNNQSLTAYIVNMVRLACTGCTISSELLYEFITGYKRFSEKNSLQCDFNRHQKIEILNSVLHYKNYNLVKLACEVFEILNEEKSSFKELISDLLQQEKLSEAAYCISVLNLQQEYPLEKIILMLLHDNQWKHALSFLKESPDLQLQIAKLLDGLINKNSNYQSISVNSRQAYRALAALVKIFKIPTVECENLHFIRSKGAINLLVRRRNQKSVSESTWEEMVLKIVDGNHGLKEHLLYKIMQYGDRETAEKMKEKLEMHSFDLDAVTILQINDRNAESDELEAEAEKSDDETEHLTFALSPTDIEFVTTRDDYQECITNISKNYKMVGVDTEWKPHFGLVRDRLALIQLAVHDRVFILDILSLNECLEPEDWDKLLEDVFSNPNIIKLGCSLMTDIQMIVENNRGTKGKSLKFTHILDMVVFFEKLQEVYPVEMEKDEDDKNLKGLSQLCKIILGKPLNKEERLCDWEKRPLTDSQLEYAALDAHCLLLMYDELKKISPEKKINFDHLVKVAMVLTSGLNKVKNKTKGLMRKSKDTLSRYPKHIQEFKVAVQPALEYISQSLKQMGADVLVLQDTDKASDAALIAKTQGRLLICFNDFKLKVQNISSDVSCYGVDCDYSNPSSLHILFRKFNIKIGGKTLIQTCQKCRSEDVMRLSLKEAIYIQRLQSDTKEAPSESISSNNVSSALNNTEEADVPLRPDNESLSSTKSVYLCKKCGLLQ